VSPAGGRRIHIPWWIHPIISAAVVTLTCITVFLGRRSARASTETYEPIARWHIAAGATTISLACVAVLLGPYLMDEAGLDAFKTPHAIVGVVAVSLWIVQGGLGWFLWRETEKVRKIHRYNGFAILGLALLQVPFGLRLFLDFLANA